jgi:hypothetical protein
MGLVAMPKKSVTKETTLPSQETVTSVRAAKPKTKKAAPVVEVASKPRVSRVKSVMHSKAAAAPVPAGVVAVNVHEEIAKIAYGYWESRGYQPGGAEQDWLRAERAYLLQS